MLDVIWTRGLPLDRITTTDVWATDTISANLPPMESFKERMDQWIWDRYHIEVEHLCARNPDGSKKTYEQMFYHVPERTRAESKFQTEAIKGFLLPTGVNWCQKLKIVNGGRRNIVEYLGIAADEPKRFSNLNEKKRAPLVEFGIEEDLCGLYCQYNGILAPSYETSCRDGCWFCHNQGVNQLRLLRKNWPEHWALLMKWDLDSPTTFKADGHTVHDYDERFRLEDEKLIDPNKPFRWAMLQGDLQLRLF